MKVTTKRFLFQVLLLLAGCLVIEVTLRKLGYAPGDLRPNWLNFAPVDSLYVIDDFYTDSNGLLVASKKYWNEQGITVNHLGFRGKEPKNLDSTKKRILVLGDSFAWGMSASPFQDSSMCDLIQQQGTYEVINTGIPAADPPQYAEIARLYASLYKPDYIIVVFFMGNDLMKFDRTVTANQPFYYWTNAGAILADIDGIHFNSPQEAYDYLANTRYYLQKPDAWYKSIIAKSSLLSRLYAGKYRVEEKIAYEKMRSNTSITKKYLYKINEVAQQNQVPVKFVLIPESKEADMDTAKYKKRYSDILLDSQLQSVWLIVTTDKSLYKENPDGHLNNTGHAYYAQILTALFDNHFYSDNK
jgi:hypothetical protein